MEDLYLPEKSLVNLLCSLRNYTTWQVALRAVDLMNNKSPFSIGQFIRIELEKIDFDPDDYIIDIIVEEEVYKEKFSFNKWWYRVKVRKLFNS